MRTALVLIVISCSVVGLAAQESLEGEVAAVEATLSGSGDETSQIDEVMAEAIDELEEDIATRSRLTGPWGGLRTELEEIGITIEPHLLLDLSRNLSGGLEDSKSAGRYFFQLGVTVDFATMFDWDSGTLFVAFQQQDGDLGSDLTGDIQYIGSYDSDGRIQISEVWFEYEFADGLIRTKIGKVDANWEFAYTELGWEFVHGSASYPATNYLLPTFPDPATSINLFVTPHDNFSLSLGMYDGALQQGISTGERGPATFWGSPSDLFFIAELGASWTIAGLPGRAALGGWHHTGDFERFDGEIDRGTSGWHLVVDQMLWLEEGPTEESGFYDQGIGLYLQYDEADGDVICIDQHIGFGFTWRGMLDGRDDDLVGLGLSWVRFRDDGDAGFDGDGELALELFYMFRVTPALFIQPDFQYIANPGGDGLDDAFVFNLRIGIDF